MSVTIEDTDDYAVDADAGSVEVTLFNTNPGLLLSKLSLTVEERTMATYTVRLATAPSGSVVVTPSVPQGASFSVTPASRSFGSPSWSTSQTFTVTPAADPDTNDEAAVSVTHSVSTSYLSSALQTATTVPSISVTVEDDGRPTVTIAADASPVTEGVEAVFTVSLSDDAASALPVMVTATQSGSFATNALPNSLTIAAGDTMAGLTIATQDDAVTEANGSVTITIATNAAYVVGNPSSATVAITDNDTPPSTLSLSGDVTRTEATENLEFTVTISRTPAVDVTVDWATADGSAASGSDYTEAAGTVTFAAGGSALAKSFTVTIREDLLDEPEEQFTVALSNAAGASIAASADTATVTITDDDVPALSIPKWVFGTEGVPGGMNFPVTLSLASALEITVDYATADGTGAGDVDPATAPSDYLSATGTLSFAPGDTTRTIAVVLVDDPDNEDQRESFTVALSNPSATAILDSNAKAAAGYIHDNDGLPTLSITNASAAEGAGEIVFAVALTGRNLDPISATWSTADGTATAPADYTAVTAGTVRIPAGELSASLTVQLAADDDVPEADKQFTVTLADPDPSDVLPLGTATATGTIVDDEMTTVTVAKGTDVTEGTAAQFTLSRIGDLTESLEVSIAVTQDGLVLTSAPPPVSATFAKGSTQVEVSVPTDDDDLDEASGSITVTVTDGETYDLRDPAAATVAVADNDLPVVTIRSTTTSITEGGSFPFEVSRVGDTTAALAVGVGVSATNDYTTSPRSDLTVAIAAGSSSAAASVTVVDNTVSRGNGSLNLLLFRDLARYRSGSPNSVSATIMDNDAAGVPVLNGVDLACPETTSEQCNVVFQLSSTATQEFDVIFRTAAGTATSEVDFNPRRNRRITVFAADTLIVESVKILPDDLDEEDETFTVTLTLADGVGAGVAVIGDPATVTITDDDVPPRLGIADSMASEGSGSMRFVATLSEESGRDVLVNWTPADGTATAPGDYTAASGILTMGAGTRNANIDVALIDDADPEPNETFQVTITSEQAIVTDGTATGTIADNDVPLSLSVGATTINEGESTDVIVESATPLPSQLIITLERGGTATEGTGAGADYTLVPSSITILAAGTRGTAKVTAALDTLVETGGETIEITARNGSAEVGTVTITISDDDTANFLLSVNPARITESDTATATVTVATGGVTFATEQTIDLALAGSAVGGGTDYTISSTTIAIAAGATDGTATVTLVNDDLVEGEESITITASHGAAQIGTSNITLLDDESADFTLSVDRATIAEGDPAAAIVTVATGGSIYAADQTLALALAGSATEGTGNDYTLVPRNITIVAGETTGTATVTPADDDVVEGEETITITASHDGIEIGTADLTVDDNDTATLGLTIADASITEGSVTTITVESDKTFAAAQAIDLDFAGSTATAADDFTISPQSIEIAAGATSVSAQVTAVDDTLVEGSEEIAIAASHEGSQIGSGTITIADNDNADFSVTVDPDIIPENESEFTTVEVATGGVTFPEVQTFSLSLSGNAIAGTDYTAPPSIEIAAGRTSGSATIRPVDDTLVEDDETIDIEVFQDTTSIGTVRVTISASDQSSFALNVTPATVAEGGTVTVEVATGGVTFGEPQEIGLSLTGSATTETDYTISSTTITIAVGATSGSATVTIVDDNQVEGRETITIAASHGGDRIDVRNITIEDNDAASFTLTVDPATIEEGATAAVTVATVEGVTFGTAQTITLVLTGSATRGTDNDYTISSTSIRIPADGTQGTATLTVLQDSLAEGPETIEIAANQGAIQVASANATIADDDLAGFTISVDPVTIAEGDPATATLTVELDGDVTFAVAQTITLTFGGSAAVDADYTVTPATITVPAGTAAGTAVVAALDDTFVEDRETILITARLGASEIGTAELAIEDDDADRLAFSLSVDPATIAEGETATVTVATGGVTFDTDQTITLTLGGSATEGANADYTITPSSITIAANATSGSATIATVQDTAVEAAETVTIAASHGVTAIDPVTVTIAASGASGFALAVAPATIEEGETATITVSTGGTTFVAVQTISLTLSGSASVDSDFMVDRSSIEIAVGATSGTATITTVDDSEAEGAETITIAASHGGTSIGTRNVTIAASDRRDASSPTVAVTSAATFPANAKFTVSIAFSESVTGLTADAVEVSNGAAANLRGSGATYQVDVTPRSDFEGSATVTVPAGAAADANGNPNVAGSAGFAVDTRAPSVRGTTLDQPIAEWIAPTDTGAETASGFVSFPSGEAGAAPSGAAASPAGTAEAPRATGYRNTLTLTYDEPLDAASNPPPAAFTVRAGGRARAVASVAVQGRSVRLTLAAPVTAGRAVTVSYAAPAGAAAIRDLAGNAAHDLAGTTVGGAAAAVDLQARLSRVNLAVLPYAAATLQAATVAAIAERVDAAGSPASWMHSGPMTGSEHLAAVDRLWNAANFVVPLAAGTGGTSSAAPTAALWGTGSYRSLSAGEGTSVDWHGEVTSFQVGGDLRVVPELLAGVAVAWSEGAFDYTDRSAGSAAADGVYETELVSVNPYLGVSVPGAGLRLWMSAGYGWGAVSVDEEASAAHSGPMWLLSGTLGGSGRLLATDGLIAGGRTLVRLKGEGSLVRVEVAASGPIAAAELDTRRLRVLLEGSHAQSLAWGARLQPAIDVGLRYEDGDGPQGAALELGGRLRYVDPGLGLTLQGHGRLLAAHDSGYEEWGAGGLLRLELGVGGRGLWLSVAPSWGDPSGGAQELWEQGVATLGAGERLADAGPAASLEARAGYGFATAAEGPLLTPYGGVTLDRAGDREYRGGVRLEIDGLELSLEVTRHEDAGHAPDHGVSIGGGLSY